MSDGLSDCAYSGKIANAGFMLASAEKEFLARPSQAALAKVRECGNSLVRYNSGYWGENPREAAGRIITHYRDRFGDSAEPKVVVGDFVRFLNDCSSIHRLRELAEIVVLMQGHSASAKGFFDTVLQAEEDITAKLTFDQKHAVIYKDVNEEGFKEILKTAGLEALFQNYLA